MWMWFDLVCDFADKGSSHCYAQNQCVQFDDISSDQMILLLSLEG